MSDVTPLPRFARPPVVETILGIYFRPMTALSGIDLAIFWDRELRGEFPKADLKPAVEAVTERFGSPIIPESLHLNLHATPPPSRLWMSTEENDHVIQLQPDALLTNWLRSEANGEYISYAGRRDRFRSQLDQLERFIGSSGEDGIRPISVTVTYINHIAINASLPVSDAIGELIVGWPGGANDKWLPQADAMKLSTSYPFQEQGGRLHLNVFPVFRSTDKSLVLRMELLGRANCREQEGVSGALQKLDLCHEWVVRGFASLTTARMHSQWERTE